MPLNKAQKLAKEYLEKINLLNIAYKRPDRCTDIEQLCTMIIRATMCKNTKIMINNPMYLLHNLKDIKDIIKEVETILNDKDIVILDLLSNEIHYKGCQCHTIK